MIIFMISLYCATIILIPTGQNEENIDLHHGMWHHMLDVAWTDLSSGDSV